MSLKFSLSLSWFLDKFMVKLVLKLCICVYLSVNMCLKIRARECLRETKNSETACVYVCKLRIILVGCMCVCECLWRVLMCLCLHETNCIQFQKNFELQERERERGGVKRGRKEGMRN